MFSGENYPCAFQTPSKRRGDEPHARLMSINAPHWRSPNHGESPQSASASRYGVSRSRVKRFNIPDSMYAFEKYDGSWKGHNWKIEGPQNDSNGKYDEHCENFGIWPHREHCNTQSEIYKLHLKAYVCNILENILFSWEQCMALFSKILR